MRTLTAKKVYLCCGNKTGVQDPDSWLGVDINQPCDVQADVRTIEKVKAHVVFATPPCSSFTDLPWRPATNKDADILKHCLDLCKQAPRWLLENNRWAQRIIGPADFHRGPHYFWGNLMVADFKRERSKQSMSGKNPLARAALPMVVIA